MPTVLGGQSLGISPSPTGSSFTSSFTTFDVGGTLEGGDTLGGGETSFGGAGSTDGGSGSGSSGSGSSGDSFDIIFGYFDKSWFPDV